MIQMTTHAPGRKRVQDWPAADFGRPDAVGLSGAMSLGSFPPAALQPGNSILGVGRVTGVRGGLSRALSADRLGGRDTHAGCCRFQKDIAGVVAGGAFRAAALVDPVSVYCFRRMAGRCIVV